MMKILFLVITVAFSGHAWTQQERYDCLIEPSMAIDIGSSIRGVADEVLFRRGDQVRKDDILVRLESGVQQASVELAKARSVSTAEVETRSESLDLSKRALERIEQLFADKNVSRQMLDEAQSETIIAQGNLQQARENKLLAELELKQASEVLALRTIRSPIDGVVVDRMIAPGELVTEDRPVMSLAMIDPLHVEVILPSTDFGSIISGSEAIIYPAAPLGGRFIGRVTIVDNIIDAASGTFGVRVELGNEDFTLPAGLNCQAEFAPKVLPM